MASVNSSDSDLRFDSVLSRRSTEKRAILFVVPGVIIVFGVIAFAVASISRTSGLQTQLRIAQQQVEEANKVVEERDRQLRDAHGETAALGSAGQGAGVLMPVEKGGAPSGVVLDHPAQHSVAVYAYNLAPAPDGQEYRLIVTDGTGQESLLGQLRPDDRGAAFLLARDVPEGLAKVEVALVPTGAAKPPQGGAQPAGSSQGAAADKNAPKAAAPTERKPVLAGELPKPGEAGVVMASTQGQAEEKPARPQRAARRGR